VRLNGKNRAAFATLWFLNIFSRSIKGMQKSRADNLVRHIVLFGATGDLAQRMLYPSLYHLAREGLISPALEIIGTARSALSGEAFKTQLAANLEKFIPPAVYDSAASTAFLARCDYLALDIAGEADYGALKARLHGESGEGVVYILSTAPALYGRIVEGLARAGLAGANTRVILEKPIGHSLASSREINDAVGAVFREQQVFRIDHYLGKETVQNLLALRFGNSLFEPLWNAIGIEHVQISVAETVGLEGRAAYYDGVGALRDMVQNHLLQLLALVAMEPPAELEPSAVRNEKVKVLRSLRPISTDMIATSTVAGQYSEGAVAGLPVRGYAEELGAATNTETFVALQAHIDNWRWAGVPFYLRTGKRMPVRRSEILIQFRAVPHSIFASQGGVLSPNKLLIRLQPEENIRLLVMAKEPGLGREGVRLREVPLDLSLSDAFSDTRRRIAYERLLLDVLDGNGTLFVRRDEVEAAWHWVDGIIEGWTRIGLVPKRYAAGTWGPSSAIALTERHGHSWHE
jgi:glucose-6-phosphate 1-dehydrogenase